MHRTFPEPWLALKLYIYSVGLCINQLKMGCMVYTKMVVVLSCKQNMGDFFTVHIFKFSEVKKKFLNQWGGRMALVFSGKSQNYVLFDSDCP